MNKVTLAVVAVLLAVPAAAHAKAGLEFDNAIETQQPGERQTFQAIVMSEPSDPDGGAPTPLVGVRPLVTFRDAGAGKVIRVRTAPTNRNGVGLGSVVLPDSGPWSATLSVNGKSFGEGPAFSLAPAAAAPAKPQPATPADDGGFPAWLLSIPAALLAAFAIRYLRRRPRELGA